MKTKKLCELLLSLLLLSGSLSLGESSGPETSCASAGMSRIIPSQTVCRISNSMFSPWRIIRRC